MYDRGLPWSDNWWIEEDKAWVCAERFGAIFCVDIKSLQWDLVAWMPYHMEIGFREYPYCIKKNDDIFCLPNRGKNIWCYNIKQKTWNQIAIKHEFSIFSYMYVYGMHSNKIWLEENSSGKIYELNLEEKEIVKQYLIPQYDNTFLGQYVLVEAMLYCVSGDSIYCIDTKSNDIKTFSLSRVKAELYTICFDGFNFWLSGHCKEIYIWNPIKGIVNVINGFPKQFGIYHFRNKKTHVVDCDTFYVEGDTFFSTSVFLGKYVWYIPDQASEIIYIDRETYEVFILEIEEERETPKSIEDHLMCSKYLMQYVREDRYIGLYSLKNRLIFEIDTVNLCVNSRKYFLSSRAIGAIVDEYYKDNKILFEGRKGDALRFEAMLKRDKKSIKIKSFNVGQLICNSLNNQ